MALMLEVSVLRALMMGPASQRHCLAARRGVSGSWRSSSETNRTRIEGRHGGETGQWTGKSDHHPDTRAAKCGRTRAKHQRLTLGDLSGFALVSSQNQLSPESDPPPPAPGVSRKGRLLP